MVSFAMTESVDDDPRAGLPRTSRTPEHIAKLRTALADNRCSKIRMLAKQYHTDEETVCKIIMENLGEKSCVRDLFPTRCVCTVNDR